MCHVLHELVLSLSDLSSVVLSCTHCGTQLVFPATNGLPEPEPNRLTLPESCPFCRKSFDSAVHKAAAELLRTFKALADSRQAAQILFRMSAPERDTATGRSSPTA